MTAVTAAIVVIAVTAATVVPVVTIATKLSKTLQQFMMSQWSSQRECGELEHFVGSLTLSVRVGLTGGHAQASV